MNRRNAHGPRATTPQRRAGARGPSPAAPWAAAACLLAACGRAPADAGAPGASAERLAATADPALDVARYDVVGEFDWAQERLRAAVTVTLSAERAPPARVVLDSRVAAITGVSLPAGEALAFAVDGAAGTLTVELGERAAPGVAFVVDYEASTPPGTEGAGTSPLTTIGARAGDPNDARAVYTMSEPIFARAWLPSHDDPSDRAFFSIDLRVGAGERLIANGDLVDDDTGGCHEGRMKYATAYPLPTYLMAFALGEFEAEEKKGPRGLPLSIWHRRGVPGDYRPMLAEIDRLVRRFEGLTGVPYPFEKYALVLLPAFPGGEEHASVSFQDEAVSAEPDSALDLSLTAHELAHQWFGDLVTMRTWDDLWFKEGMATLLEVEGTRPYYDRDGTGTPEAEFFFVRNGQAARDPALPPAEKYTSGTYGRAAWVLTQVRARVGDAAFWAAWRDVLTRYRFGTVGLDEIADAFRPALGGPGVEQLRRALEAKALPALTFEPLEGGARVTLTDPEGALVEPLRVDWHRTDGSVDTVDLAPGANDLVRASPDDMLVVDPADVHPSWRWLAASAAERGAYYATVVPLLGPTNEAQRERFLEIGGSRQWSAFIAGTLPPLEPGELPDFLRELDSDVARTWAVSLACDRAAAEGGAWVPAVKHVLRTQPFFVGLRFSPGYESCSAIAPPAELFPVRWQLLGTGLRWPLLNENQVEYLALFTAPAADMLRTWSVVVERGYSVRVRSVAAEALYFHTFSAAGIPEAELPAWRARVAELVAGSEVVSVQRNLIALLGFVAGPTAAENAAGLGALGAALRTPKLANVHADAACTAYALTAGDEAAWQAFVAGLEGAELSPPVREILDDAAGFCG